MTVTDTDLMAYADGELNAETVRAVEAAVGSDPEAYAKVEMFRQTRGMLKAACAEDFYTTGLEHLRALPSPSRSAARRVYAAAAAACLVAAVAGFGGGKLAYGRESARDALLNEVAEYHEVYSHEGLHLVEVSAENSADLQDWLGQRLGRKMPIPDLSTLGMRFAGGRMLVVDGKPVGELMYVRPVGLPVAICVTRLDGAPQPLRVDAKQGMTLASWTDGRYAYVVVGDLEAKAAAGMVELAAARFRT